EATKNSEKPILLFLLKKDILSRNALGLSQNRWEATPPTSQGRIDNHITSSQLLGKIIRTSQGRKERSRGSLVKAIKKNSQFFKDQVSVFTNPKKKILS
ncbi:MAG: hypothetical protein Q8877_03460, partial [Sweet potato little leaf phytoplasma]|nr:hypothetical protein [Sweet potato little leaf phytoplasma]